MTNAPRASLIANSAAVRFEKVRFAWPRAERSCLDVPGFEIAMGERVFILGPSGSGKSTLLSLIGGVVTPGAGRVEVLGQNLASLSNRARDRFRADHIGFIFQLFNLIPYLSALDNIVLPCRFSPVRRARAGNDVMAAARRLAERLDLQPGLLARQASDLSVGQQQRVAAARALIGRPELIIADEPTSALDADRQRGFLELLLEECGASDATLLFVSHDRGLSGQFDRVLDLPTLNRASMMEHA